MTGLRLDPLDAAAHPPAAGGAARPAPVLGLLAGALATSRALGVLVGRMVVAPDPQHIDPFRPVERRTRRASVTRAA